MKVWRYEAYTLWYLAVFSMTGPISAFACKTVQSIHDPNNTKSLKIALF